MDQITEFSINNNNHFFSFMTFKLIIYYQYTFVIFGGGGGGGGGEELHLFCAAPIKRWGWGATGFFWGLVPFLIY